MELHLTLVVTRMTFSIENVDYVRAAFLCAMLLNFEESTEADFGTFSKHVPSSAMVLSKNITLFTNFNFVRNLCNQFGCRIQGKIHNSILNTNAQISAAVSKMSKLLTTEFNHQAEANIK